MAASKAEYRCFVGGLAWAITDQILGEAFSEYGEVLESKVINDRETGRSRGFGFVTFKDEQSMRDAIEEMNGEELEGRTITVNEAQSGGGGGGFRGPRREGGGYGGGRREGGYGGGGGYGGVRREGGYGGVRREGGFGGVRREGSYGGGDRGYGGGGGGGGGGVSRYSRGGGASDGNWREIKF